MAFWKRFGNCISAHASSILSRFENPIVKAEHAIESLKDLHSKAFEDLAQVKVLIVLIRSDIESRKNQIDSLEARINQLLSRAKDDDALRDSAEDQASSLIGSMLKVQKEQDFLVSSLSKYEKMEESLESKLFKIKQQISDCQFKLTSLKSRMNVAVTLKELSKSTGSMADDSVASLMKDIDVKVRTEEALADAYDAINEEDAKNFGGALLESEQDQQVREKLSSYKKELWS